MKNRIDNPRVFFAELGGLHDARIESLRWLVKSRRLELAIDEINSNFAGLPDYLGFQPQVILLDDVAEIELLKSPCEDVLKIYDLICTPKGDAHFVEFKCSPGGSIKVTCSSISLMDPVSEVDVARP